MTGQDPKALGLVKYVEHGETQSDSRYKLVKHDSKYTYIVDPRSFTATAISDLSSTYGTIDTGVFVKSVSVKGQTTTDAGLATQTVQRLPVTLGNNPINGQDPDTYRTMLRSISNRSAATLAGTAPTEDTPYNPMLLYHQVNLNTTSLDMTSLPGIYLDTNAPITITALGGGSITIPAAIFNALASKTLTVEIDRITLGGFRYIMRLGNYQASGFYNPGYQKVANVNSAVQYWLSNGLMDLTLRNVGGVRVLADWIISLTSGSITEAGGANVGGTLDFLERTLYSTEAYNGRKNVFENLGGEVTATTGSVVDYFLTISYPILNFVNIGQSRVQPALLEVNNRQTFEVNQWFANFPAAINYVASNYGGTLVDLDFELSVEYGDYSSLLRQYITRGGLLR